MSRKILAIALLILSIGFASINTTMYVEGHSKVVFNEDDFKVYFSGVQLDEEDYTNQLLSEDKKKITYTATTLKTAGSSINLTYDIANSSTQYDAVVEVECSSTLSQVNIPNSEEGILLNSKEIKSRGITLSLNQTITNDAVITCTIDAIPSERIIANEEELTEVDTYILYGNYMDNNNVAISNANLVVYSNTPHYVTTDENGYLFYNGLEQGVHEIYYVDNTLENIKAMTKEQVVANAVSNAEFTTTTTGDILFKNNSVITNKGIMKTQSFCKTQLGNKWEFSYTGASQEFTTLCDGMYKIELWGASGGYGIVGSGKTYEGGYGGYTSGEIALNKETALYLYVGNEGQGGKSNSAKPAAYNGGGASSYYSVGGGATDIRLTPGDWDSFEGLKTRIMVAGGGGGASADSKGGGYCLAGAGGGLVGLDGKPQNNSSSTYGEAGAGGTQTSGFKFGIGFSSSAGGGGGYYGSSKRNGTTSWAVCGGGGSSFISGHSGCDAIAENSTEDSIIHTGQANHYSGYVFKKTKMIAGNASMPTHDGTSTMKGNKGTGYAKITLISLK